jgi:hypothetical protein
VSKDVFCAVVDVEVIVAKEADEGDIEVLCDLYGEAGGGAYGDDHVDSAHEGFLQELEAGSAGE